MGKTATLAIGLGGMGINCLQCVKRKVYESVKSDNPAAGVPEYSHIVFWGVDSDMHQIPWEAENIWYLDRNREFFHMYSHVGPFEGVGAVREVGYQLFRERSGEFFIKLLERIRQIYGAADRTRGVDVHIFTGLCGGTGSGIFLDVCYMVRKALEEMGIRNYRMAGYFFTPNALWGRFPAAVIPAAAMEMHRRNFQEAMKALDHCMEADGGYEVWNRQYGNLCVSSRQRPVDVCHLISNANIEWVVPRESSLYDIVADFVRGFFVEQGLSLERYVYDMPNGWWADDGARVHNRYCGLGSAVFQVPKDGVECLLRKRFLQCAVKGGDNQPKEEDWKKALHYVGLDDKEIYGRLQRNLPKDVTELFPREVLTGRTSEFTGEMRQQPANMLGLPMEIWHTYERWLEEGKYHLEQSKYMLEQEFRSALWQRVLDMAGNPEQGIVYAAQLLSERHSCYPSNYLDDCRRRAEEAIYHGKYAIEGMIRTVKELVSDVCASNFLIRNRRFLFLMDAVNDLYRQRYQAELTQTLLQVMDRERQIVAELAEGVLWPYAVALRRMENRTIFNFHGVAAPQMSAIQRMAEDIWEQQHWEDAVSEMQIAFLDQQRRYESRHGNSEAETAQFIEGCISQCMQNIGSFSLSQYMNILWGQMTPQEFADRISNQIVPELRHKSLPLFQLRPEYRYPTPESTLFWTCSQMEGNLWHVMQNIALNADDMLRDNPERDRIEVKYVVHGLSKEACCDWMNENT